MSIDFGYPKGDNVVRPPATKFDCDANLSALGEAGRNLLSSLYAVCDGLSFPDVHVGYFIDPVSRLPTNSDQLNSLLWEEAFRVLQIGSTGGGSRIVVRCDDGAVLVLPPGRIVEGKYAPTRIQPKNAGTTIEEFLEHLLRDLTAVVNDERNHKFLVS